MKYKVIFSNKALKEYEKLSKKQKIKLMEIHDFVLTIDPLLGKNLSGDFEDHFSLRLNIKDRIVYRIDKKNKIVYLKSLRRHYND